MKQLEYMIDSQIKARGINDQRLLEALTKVDRRLFVPTEEQTHAYEDRPLPIGQHQTISQPYIVSYMLDKLQLKPTDKVLEIGTGSGFQTALLSLLCKEVFSVEIIKPLLIQAQGRLKKFSNIEFKLAGNDLGWKEHQPYDKIIVSAAAGTLPMLLIQQLKRNGSMIIPIGLDQQELMLIHRNQDDMKLERLLPVSFVPLAQ